MTDQERLEQIRNRVEAGVVYYAREDMPYLIAQLAQAQERLKTTLEIIGLQAQESAELQAENARLREHINKIIEYTNTRYNDGFLRAQVRQAAEAALAPPEGEYD